jgi:hypothetical protein
MPLHALVRRFAGSTILKPNGGAPLDRLQKLIGAGERDATPLLDQARLVLTAIPRPVRAHVVTDLEAFPSKGKRAYIFYIRDRHVTSIGRLTGLCQRVAHRE